MAEQVNQNALGAPAEGFGQTVSFAFDPRGEAPVQQPITSRPAGGGFSNVSTPRGIDPNRALAEPAEKPDPTAALLMKVGEDILSKKLEQERNAKFVGGMQQAMNGAAIKDIVDSVPWYAKIFGDTPVIEGARAYTANATVNQSVANEVGNMAKLQELSGPDAAKHFSGVISRSLTGDAGTDAVIMKGMAEQMPSLMKAQAKSHYAYNQKQAMSALSRSMVSGAAGLQANGELFSDDKINNEDMQSISQGYLRSIIPPEGIDEENYSKVLTSNMQGMALKGQFHALNVLKQGGALSALAPEQANRVDAAIMAAATKSRDNYAFKFAGEIAEIKSDAMNPATGQTPRQISDRIDTMNTKYQKVTGSPVGLFSSDQKGDMIAGTFNALKAEQVRAAGAHTTMTNAASTESAKAQAAIDLDLSVRALISNGDIGALKVMQGVSTDMIDRTVLDMAANSPDSGAKLLADAWVKDEYVNDIVSKRLTAPLRQAGNSEVPTDGWFKAIVQFNTLKETVGLPMANDYFKGYGKQLERASRMLGERVLDHPQSAAIFQATMGGTQAKAPVPLTAKEHKVLMGQVANMNSNYLVRKFTGTSRLREDTLTLLGDIAAQSTEDWRGTDMPDNEAVAMGLADAASTGRVEVLGGYGIKNMDGKPGGKRPPTLRELASSATSQVSINKVDAYFEDFLGDYKGVDSGASIKIIRKGEANGTTHFTVASLKDGKTDTYSFTAAEWQAYAGSRNTSDTAPAKPDPTRFQFGPKLTMRPPPGGSIYRQSNLDIQDTIKGIMTNKTTKGDSLYGKAAEDAQLQADVLRKNRPKP